MIDLTRLQRTARWMVLALGGAICVVAVLAILAGAWDARSLAAFGPSRVPMSFLGGILMVLLGASILAVEARPRSPWIHRMGVATALAVLLLSLGLAAAHLLGRFPNQVSWPFLGRPTSLLTCLVVALGAWSAVTRWIRPDPTWRTRQMAALLAQVPLAIGTVVLVSYAAGAPLLYESALTPMSLPSALCSVGLGAALMVAAGCDTWPLAVFGFAPRKGPHLMTHWFTTGPLALFLLLGVLVLTGGSFLLRGQLKSTRAQVHAELSTIAEFKAHQVGAWLAERRGAADRMFHATLIQGGMRRFLAGAPNAPAEAQLQEWMETLQKGTYRRVVLFDRAGRVRMSVPSGESTTLEDMDASELGQALTAREVTVRDLHRHPGRPEIHLSMWIPIGVRPEPGQRSDGVLLLMMDPQEFLYPLIRSWPTASPSAETLLVRREGDDVLFLNTPRQLSQSAMSFRLPIWGHQGMPAVMAARGGEGLVAGLDYRNEPVLAAVHQVPGMPWGMVTKVDEAEVYGPLRRRIWTGGIGLIGVVVIVAAGLGLMVRHHDGEMVRQQLVLSHRFEWLMREANDIILLMDGDGVIQEANTRAVDQYGYPLSELRGMKVMDLRSDGTRHEALAQMARLKADGSIRFETVHRCRNGREFPVEISSRWVNLDQEAMIVSFVRDISGHRAQQRELLRMTRLYAALSHVSEAIVRTQTREELVAKICQVMVDHGGFRMAWIGWNDPTTGRVAVASRYGDIEGYLDTLAVRSDDTPLGRGPMGTAIREGRPCIQNDFQGVAGAEAWNEAARRSGFASAAAFPIREGGAVWGGIAVYAAEKGIFGPHEADLLGEAAMDVSFALDHLASEARRREVEAALLESERFLREAEEAGGIGTYTFDLRNDRWKGSPLLDRLLGITPDHPRNLEGWLAIVAPGWRERVQAYLAGTIERRSRFDLDYAIIRPSDGARRWVHASGELQWDGEGRATALVGVIRDITEQREDEASLQKISVAVEQSSLSVVITDLNGTIEYVNPKFTQVTGYTPGEALGQNPRILKSPATPPEQYRQMWEVLGRGEIWVGEFENRKKNGEAFHERATIAPVRDATGAVASYIALKEDITQQMRDDAARRSLEAQLHQSQKLESLGSLAGGVAHDMNNVLGAILGVATAQRELLPGGDPMARALDTIVNACLRGRGVVKGLLYFARKELDETKPVELNALARDMVQLLAHTTLQKIGFNLDLEEGLPVISGDPGALNHALMNLCVNAVDAMPAGGTLTLRTWNRDGAASLSVRDTGQGMSPATLAKATEPFFTTKAAGKGTGLGLSMVFGTMKAHGGSLELHSREGVGTEAILHFPKAAPAEAPKAAEAPARADEPSRPLKILLVDDDELIRESLTLLLESVGHRVHAAPGGADAIHYVQGGADVDVVILDMNMPGLSGAETLPRILALRPGQPVLMASGFSESDLEGILASHPSVRSLAKPFTLRELQHKLAGMAAARMGARGSDAVEGVPARHHVPG